MVLNDKMISTSVRFLNDLTGSKSTGAYLQTGIEGLRSCAIDPEEVFKDV